MRPIRAAAAAVIIAMSAALVSWSCASAPGAPPGPVNPVNPVNPVKKIPPAVTPIVGAGHAPGDILHAWTQVAPGGARYGGTVGLARVIVAGQGQACPKIQLGDLPAVAMTERPNPLPGSASYPITVCEHPLVLPDGRPAPRAQVADRLLPLPGTTPARIAMIGGTGCRKGEESQWPFEKIARTVARRQSPTLVVHVGDYRDRKTDTWEGWEDGFFKPAEELLQVAPWLMERSNHEDCGLTGKDGDGRGWLYLLDPSSTLLGTSPLPACSAEPKTPTAVDVPQGGGAAQRLVVLDSGYLDNGFLMLVWSDTAKTWQATLSSPKGDETRACRFGEAGLECGFPAAEPCRP
jgi:hypothetical protein